MAERTSMRVSSPFAAVSLRAEKQGRMWPIYDFLDAKPEAQRAGEKRRSREEQTVGEEHRGGRRLPLVGAQWLSRREKATGFARAGALAHATLPTAQREHEPRQQNAEDREVTPVSQCQVGGGGGSGGGTRWRRRLLRRRRGVWRWRCRPAAQRPAAWHGVKCLPPCRF